MAGYRLVQSEMEAVAAVPDPAPVKAPLSVQATTIQEIEASEVQAVVDQAVIFEDDTFGYHISYPLDWDKVQLSANVVSFQAPDGVTQVKVEVVGPLPSDGLGPFVDRSLGNDQVLSRQLLTVHGFSAERVITLSNINGDQITTFYIDTGDSAFVVSGVGEQKAIEMIARSFNVPQFVAQR